MLTLTARIVHEVPTVKPRFVMYDPSKVVVTFHGVPLAGYVNAGPVSVGYSTTIMAGTIAGTAIACTVETEDE